MNDKKILDEIGLDKLRAAARYYEKMQREKTPQRVGRIANMFGVSPRKLQNELIKQNIKQADPPMKKLSDSKKKKKKAKGAVPLATIAGYSGAPAQAGGMGGGSGDGGAVGEASGSTFDNSDIDPILSMDLESGKEHAKKLIMNNWSTEENKRKQLRSLHKARNTSNIVALLYNILLRGEGLGTISARGKRESTLDEKAPPGQEDFIKSAKDNFKKQYGTDWKTALYSTAWKRHNQKNEGLDEASHNFEYDLALAGSPGEVVATTQKYLKRMGLNAEIGPGAYRTIGVGLMKKGGYEEAGKLLLMANERLRDFERMPKKTVSESAHEDFFGNWKAVVKTADGSYDVLEDFKLSKDDLLRLKKREIAMRHKVRIEDVYLYNNEPELDEARMTSSTAGNTANRVYGLNSSSRKLVAKDKFKVYIHYPGSGFSEAGEYATVYPGDVIWNLPGGVIIDGSDVINVVKKIGGAYYKDFGGVVTKNRHNMSAIVKHAEEVQEEGVINKINGAKKKVKRDVNISQRRPHEHKTPSEKLQNKQRRDK